MKQIFSFGDGERLNFQWYIFNLLPHDNNCTIPLINIHYLYANIAGLHHILTLTAYLAPRYGTRLLIK